MRKELLKNSNRVAVLSVVAMLHVGCDNYEDLPDERVSTTNVSFTTADYWPDYGEMIRANGHETFTVRTKSLPGGDLEVQVKTEAINASFSGTESQDDYVHQWDGPTGDWIVLGGPVGSERVIQESISLRNKRTSEETEGLVVTKARIGPGGTVSFEVLKVIQLP